LNWLESVYLAGLALVQIYNDAVHETLFGSSMPFLPLLLISCSSAIGVLYVFVLLYREILSSSPIENQFARSFAHTAFASPSPARPEFFASASPSVTPIRSLDRPAPVPVADAGALTHTTTSTTTSSVAPATGRYRQSSTRESSARTLTAAKSDSALRYGNTITKSKTS